MTRHCAEILRFASGSGFFTLHVAGVSAARGTEAACLGGTVKLVSGAYLEGEVVADEDGDPIEAADVRPLPADIAPSTAVPAVREMRTAAIAAAGGALAGVATVAATRALVAAGAKRRAPKMSPVRRALNGPMNVVASKSFLVDVHLLDR